MSESPSFAYDDLMRTALSKHGLRPKPRSDDYAHVQNLVESGRSWKEFMLCSQIGMDVFGVEYVEPERPTFSESYDGYDFQARCQRACMGCHVLEQCFEDALTSEQWPRQGTTAGLPRRDLSRMRTILEQQSAETAYL